MYYLMFCFHDFNESRVEALQHHLLVLNACLNLHLNTREIQMQTEKKCYEQVKQKGNVQAYYNNKTIYSF